MEPWKIATTALGACLAASLLVSAWLGSELTTTRAALRDANARADAAEASAQGGPDTRRGPRGLQALGEAGRFRAAVDRSGPSDDGGAPLRALDADATLPPEILERARAQIRSEWRDRAELRREQAREAFEQFVEDENLAPELVDRAYDLWEGHRARLDALRDSAMSPDSDRRQVREEFRAAREELQSGLIEIFGEEGADRLRQALPAPPMGPGTMGPGAMGPRFGGPPGGR
jgi:hypothetical protein